MITITTIIRWVAGWVWTPLLARGALWAGAFFALAHVGAGAALRVVGEPPRALGKGVASSVPAKLPAATAAPRAPCPKRPKAAGATLDLNRANAKELEGLPGIGPKRALAIIALRDRLGGFRRARDLMRVRGIGYRSLKRLEPLVVIGPRPDPPKRSP